MCVCVCFFSLSSAGTQDGVDAYTIRMQFLKLLELLGHYMATGLVLVFVERQESADTLFKDVCGGAPCVSHPMAAVKWTRWNYSWCERDTRASRYTEAWTRYVGTGQRRTVDLPCNSFVVHRRIGTARWRTLRRIT